ncbi:MULTISPECIES: PTS transporter subunit EIIC [unclassified Paenibacillus]|uniref:PTS transporter subunit EIIC n=1 Tax=unclassified Paenibacillus TaxID=185978 RepID=UPI0009A6139F|nr:MULTISPECIES: PTS transporter subunit EIIC [unclassified Paenibacillus]SLK11966.1 PTS system, beta-glucosides-specific IIC component [Paenibacillus sp. RU5A]SOC72464.1 PTS system, beta-glucosides-specific IIC component [Paenibacillus sp. RU26A]SOC74877.1 PTS system, beta-glucosides-specific IIC component [Paenibacillus sp. RU5M]
MNDKQIEALLKLAGGKENIRHVQHDMDTTTLTLRDRTRMDLSVSDELDLGADIRITGDYCSIAYEDESSQLYNTLQGMGVGKAEGDALPETRRTRKKSLLYFISDVFRPLMPAILGAAVLKIVLAVITLFNESSLMDSQTFLIFKSIGDSVYYLLPILVALSTAYRLKSNIYVAAAIGGLMFYPQMTALLSGEEDVHFMGVPIVSQAVFFSATIWVILTICAASYLERVVERISPRVFKGILAPLLTFLILVPLVLMVLGPIGTWIDQYLPDVVDSLLNDAPIVAIMLLGAVYSLMMIAGLHYWLLPIIINELMVNGFSLILPVMLVAFVAQAGASLATGLRSKQREFRKLAFWATGTALLGTPEPAMYAVNMRKRASFYSALLGGAAGGLYFGLMSVIAVALGGSGSLLEIPLFMEEGSLNLLHACVGLIISFCVSGVLTYWMIGKERKHV